MIQAAINGNRNDSIVPRTTVQIVNNVWKCVLQGTHCIHFHVRDQQGEETLSNLYVEQQLRAIRKYLPPISLGISTGAWIEPDIEKRIALIKDWQYLPDFVSINFDEEGYEQVVKVVQQKGIAIEAGLKDVLATQNFLNCDSITTPLRILIEPSEQDIVLALARLRLHTER